MRKISTIILFLIIFSACNGKKNDELNNTLNSAGNNKQELVKVLKYYKNKDSLKNIAAEYLISNMHGHYSSSKLIKEIPVHKAIFDEIDNQAKTHYIFELTNSKPKINVHFWKFAMRTVIPKIIDKSKSNFIIDGYFADEKEIKAKRLINHIDSSFIAWKQSDLAKNMDFEEFKQTILPYRYDNSDQLKKTVNFIRNC